MCKKTTIFKSFKTAATLQWIDSNVKIIIAHTPNAFAPENRKKSRKKIFKKVQSKNKDCENYIWMTTLQPLRIYVLRHNKQCHRSILATEVVLFSIFHNLKKYNLKKYNELSWV